LFVWLFMAALAIFQLSSAVSIPGDRAANLDLCWALVAFSSEDSFTCHTYWVSVYTVSSEWPLPTSHCGIRTRNVRIIRPLPRRFNRCAVYRGQSMYQDGKPLYSQGETFFFYVKHVERTCRYLCFPQDKSTIYYDIHTYQI
jgi:hypothetical protein